MSDEIRVPVKVWLRGVTYRALAARNPNGEVGQLLEAIADRVVEGRPRRSRKGAPRGRADRTRMTDDELAIATRLHADGKTDNEIARDLGRSQAAVSRRLRTLGLPPNGTKIGGRQRA